MKVKWRRAAFREIRLSPEVTGEIARRGQAVASASGDGFESNTQPGRSRARALIYPVTLHAIRRNAKRHTLLNNFDAARR